MASGLACWACSVMTAYHSAVGMQAYSLQEAAAHLCPCASMLTAVVTTVDTCGRCVHDRAACSIAARSRDGVSHDARPDPSMCVSGTKMEGE